jgi:uncharacterized protein YbaR (Trm112 family)
VVSVPEELLEIMACPACRASLREEGDALVCAGCGLHYPVSEGIPVMLPETAYRPEEGGARDDDA